MDPAQLTNDVGGYLEPLLEQILIFIPKLITAVIIFLVTIYVGALVAKAVRRLARKRNMDPELVILFSRVAQWSVIVIGTLWALETVDKNITAFIAGLGIAGFTIGFALQDITKNFVAGMLLLLQQPFDVGDTIKVVGYTGAVSEVSLRDTQMITLDGLHVTIPNANVYTNPITNYSKAKRRRVALDIGVAYGSDLEHVTETAQEAIKSLPGIILDDPAPSVVFKNFGDSSIDFTLYYWIDASESDLFTATDQGIKLVNAAFQRENIEIPYPIRVNLQPSQQSTINSQQSTINESGQRSSATRQESAL